MGIYIFGVDGGVMVDQDENAGVVVRGLVTVGVVGAYARFGALLDAPHASFQEIGVLLKAPIPVLN